MYRKRTIRGRSITDEDIEDIRNIIKEHFHKGRTHISHQLSHHWRWYQPNGQTKDMACRYILLSLEKQGHILLPRPHQSPHNDKRKVKQYSLPEVPMEGTVKEHASVKLELLSKRSEYSLWNKIVGNYHYQSYQVIVGKFLKYIAYINGSPAACLGWGSGAWSIESRDTWIGWDKRTKDKNLCGIVNNVRFLILPWVRIKYLASHLLGLSAKRVPLDWAARYGHHIYLLESFVEKERFDGTCYKASNWIFPGQTKGNSKRGNAHQFHGNIKRVFVYPLCGDFRDKLKGKVDDAKDFYLMNYLTRKLID